MNVKKQTIRISFESKDRAIAILRSLIRSRYFETLPGEAELSRLLRIPRSSIIVALQHFEAEGLIHQDAKKEHWVYTDFATPPIGEVLFVVNTDILRGWYSLFQDWLIGFESTLFEEGYQTKVLSDFSTTKDKIKKILDARDHSTMGLVLASRAEKSVIKAVVENRIPAVTLGNATIKQQELGCVCTDNLAGMEKLVDYLLSCNHSRIAMYVNGLNFHHGFMERFLSYQHCMKHHGLDSILDLVFFDPHTAVTARRAAEIFYGMPRKPTAIICSSDREAFEIVAELKHLNIDVPGHVSIVGFDNNHYGQILEPPMTTVDIYAVQMGRVAANYLLNEMQAPQLPVKIQLPTELVLRGSVLTLEAPNRKPVATVSKTAEQGKILSF